MMLHRESHRIDRVGWLRAAVLGANDGLVSTASLIVGVTAAAADKSAILLAGVAGLVAGAMSMAAGEYVSVSSQSDTERADLAKETQELATDPERELAELAQIYAARGLSPDTAREVARQLTEAGALKAHARDELGINDMAAARPVQAALVSALTFSSGSIPPLLAVWFAPLNALTPTIALSTLVFLAVLGGLGAQLGGAPIARAALRVTVWGALAMAVTALIGRLAGAVV
jgi:VIT1/CCC1 family predicted Fe2+/Mn2+ transporter